MEAFLFCLGLALGSFIHVLASRYDPERFILTHSTLGGRSYCPHCRKVLRWYELVPLFSFLAQRGRCRACGAKIGWSHVWVELASGLIVAAVPLYALRVPLPGNGPDSLALATIWTLAFLVLLLVTLIDLRLQIIPDELVITLGLLGLGVILGEPLSSGAWLWHLAAAAAAALFFAALIAITRGKGMGIGDAKLAFALGLLFGWPQAALLLMLAFVIGAAAGTMLIIVGSKKLSSAVPFGPFLGFAAAIVFFFGESLLRNWYNLIV